MSLENPQFLHKKYQDLNTSEEVDSAAHRTNVRAEHNDDIEEVSAKPADRIQNYLDRFKEIIDRPDEAKRERGLEALKHVLHDKFVIKPEEVPEGYFANQQRLAREQGYGDVEITDDQRSQHTEVIITDQASSLDTWIDYLSSKDAIYPDWLKYYAFRGMLGMSTYDKEKQQFGKRDKGTTAPFPDLNREALAYVLDAINKKYFPSEKKVVQQPEADLTPEEQERKKQEELQYQTILQGENFAKLYAWAIEKVTPASKEALEKAEGIWIKYDKGCDHMPLVTSLQGHGTGWCTAGESTAESQLQAGDFYVYYSYDEHGKPTIPRAAIRMQGNMIGEVRGVAEQQNLDPYITDVVKDKLTEFPDGSAYEKKSDDMKTLTAIETKTKKSEALTKDELVFLYEINQPIDGFGYERDPRIEELRATRNPVEDASLILDCRRDQIAWKQEAITETTKVYIGPLFPEIFQKNLRHIYTSFPEGKVELFQAEIGGKTNKVELLDLVKLSVKDLGFDSIATTDEIYKKAEELGLELCPAEVGPHLRLQAVKQKLNDWHWIAMKQIVGRADRLLVVRLDRGGGGLWEDDLWAEPSYGWDPDSCFVFRRRPRVVEISN